MAVKVVGKDPSVVYRVTCRNCSSILEYTKEDTKRRTVRDYLGDTECYSIIKCPNCKKEVSVT